MDYFRSANNQIQADFAHRVGRIATVYEKSTKAYPPDQVYEATLHICLLQNLLTSCSELIKTMSRRERTSSFFTARFVDIPSLWGLRSSMVEINTFHRAETTYEDVIGHLRNALSHPTALNLSAEFPSTGFDSIQPKDGLISTVTFVNSPDVKENRPKMFQQRNEAERVMRLRGFPPNVEVRAATNGNHNKYQIFRQDDVYIRLFKIDVPVSNLKQFVLGLSDHLSIAAKPEWEKYLAEREAEQSKVG